jgi:cell division protein FtsB
MNWLKYLVGISAIAIAGCAAYFSVTGLGILFSGASAAVMIMAGSLEFAKLVAATYLKQTWSKGWGFNKIYLTLSVAILMVITSAGIFGYLSNAFQQQNLQLQQVDREIQVWNNKIVQDTAQIGQLTRQITELNQNQGRIIGDGRVNSRTLRSIDNRDAQIGKLQDKISVLQDSVVVFNEKINQIKTNNIGLEREVGGFRFVAEAFGVDLNTVVKFFIFLIVIVFDPLAIALVIAFNGLISKKDEDTPDIVEKNYEIYGDDGKKSPNSEENTTIVENNQQNEPETPQIPQKPVAQFDSNSGGYTYS